MKSKNINFNRREEYIECNLIERYLKVVVEESNGTNFQVCDHTLTLSHQVENSKVVFRGFYKENQIIIPLIGRDYEPGEYTLPKELIGFTRDRIREAISWYIDRF